MEFARKPWSMWTVKLSIHQRKVSINFSNSFDFNLKKLYFLADWTSRTPKQGRKQECNPFQINIGIGGTRHMVILVSYVFKEDGGIFWWMQSLGNIIVTNGYVLTSDLFSWDSRNIPQSTRTHMERGPPNERTSWHSIFQHSSSVWSHYICCLLWLPCWL